MSALSSLRFQKARAEAKFAALEREATNIFRLRSGAASFRRLADSWREVAELTRAELCELRAQGLDFEADQIESGGAK